MTLVGKKDAIILLLGDILSFCFSLWLALFVRYFELPSLDVFYLNFLAFLPAFILWLLVFFVFGLYDRYTTAFKRRLPDTIFNVNILNGVIALFIFYISSDSNITPKTNLLLCLLFSIFFVTVWRVFIFGTFRTPKIGKVLFVGTGKEIREIKEEIAKNKNYGINVLEEDNFNEKIISKIKEEKIKNIVVNLRQLENSDSQLVYSLLSSGINIIDTEEVYESLFYKVSLSYIDENWFVKFGANKPMLFYDILKRAEDIVFSLILGVFSLFLSPFVYLAIKLEDGGDVVFFQDRVGQNGKKVRIMKFRSMSQIDSGKWVVKNDPRITTVGNFLRKSRIDELPQLWNVLKGDISLIGPRPEIQKFVDLYQREIPYYNMRHLIKPGLSGWAQIHHEKPPQSIEETRDKLAYDLYYVKNRSIMLDLEITLKTIKTLLSRTGM